MSKRRFSEMQKEGFGYDPSSKPRVSLMNGRFLRYEGRASEVKENSHRAQIRKAINRLKDTFQPKCSIDFCCPLQSGWKVFEDYDCALLAGDESPFYYYSGRKEYVFQILVKSTQCKQYFVWRRSNPSMLVYWNPTGDLDGELRGPIFSSEEAIKIFESIFEDKTGNKWSEKNRFQQKPGKCQLWTEYHFRFIPFDSFAPSVLDSKLRQLMGVITANFTFELQRMNLDLKKMPITHLNSVQIEEGYKILDEIETAIQAKTAVSQLGHLTKHFYRLIPHTAKVFQPTFNDLYSVQEKKKLLKVLEDIELTNRLLRERLQEIPWIYLLRNDDFRVSDQKPVFPSVIDMHYELLNCKLTYVDGECDAYELIQNYVKNTGLFLVDSICKVQREDEERCYAKNNSLNNRKLLWYGADIASVATTLRCGLRINYHLNGRLGNGLHFASQTAKAVNSVSYNVEGQGVMFLCEVALGKEYHTLEDDDALLAAPEGFQSVVGKGIREPDPAKDVTIILDGREVVVPQGRPRIMEDCRQSRFLHSEYVVYQESQVCIRYLVQVGCRHIRLK